MSLPFDDSFSPFGDDPDGTQASAFWAMWEANQAYAAAAPRRAALGLYAQWKARKKAVAATARRCEAKTFGDKTVESSRRFHELLVHLCNLQDKTEKASSATSSDRDGDTIMGSTTHTQANAQMVSPTLNSNSSAIRSSTQTANRVAFKPDECLGMDLITRSPIKHRKTDVNNVPEYDLIREEIPSGENEAATQQRRNMEVLLGSQDFSIQDNLTQKNLDIAKENTQQREREAFKNGAMHFKCYICSPGPSERRDSHFKRLISLARTCGRIEEYTGEERGRVHYNKHGIILQVRDHPERPKPEWVVSRSPDKHEYWKYYQRKRMMPKIGNRKNRYRNKRTCWGDIWEKRKAMREAYIREEDKRLAPLDAILEEQKGQRLHKPSTYTKRRRNSI